MFLRVPVADIEIRLFLARRISVSVGVASDAGQVLTGSVVVSGLIAATAADWVVSVPAVTYPRIRSGCLCRVWPRQTAYLGCLVQVVPAPDSSRCTLSVAVRFQGRAARGHPHARMPLRGKRLTPALMRLSPRPTNRIGGKKLSSGFRPVLP